MSDQSEKQRDAMRIRAEGNGLYFDEENSHTTENTWIADVRNVGLAIMLAARWNAALEDGYPPESWRQVKQKICSIFACEWEDLTPEMRLNFCEMYAEGKFETINPQPNQDKNESS